MQYVNWMDEFLKNVKKKNETKIKRFWVTGNPINAKPRIQQD